MAQHKQNLAEFKTYIFDWDGTLSKLSVIYFLNRAINPYMLYRKHRAFKSTSSADRRDIEKALRNAYTNGHTLRRKQDRFLVSIIDLIHRFSKPHGYPGSVELLRELKREGKYVAVFTDGKLERVIMEATKLRLIRHIDIIVSAQSFGRLKPDPTGIEAIIKAAHADRSECLMIGDMLDDIVAARLSKIKVCSVGGGFSSMGYLAMNNPDFLVSGIKEILNEFKRPTPIKRNK